MNSAVLKAAETQKANSDAKKPVQIQKELGICDSKNSERCNKDKIVRKEEEEEVEDEFLSTRFQMDPKRRNDLRRASVRNVGSSYLSLPLCLNLTYNSFIYDINWLK